MSNDLFEEITFLCDTIEVMVIQKSSLCTLYRGDGYAKGTLQKGESVFAYTCRETKQTANTIVVIVNINNTDNVMIAYTREWRGSFDWAYLGKKDGVTIVSSI